MRRYLGATTDAQAVAAVAATAPTADPGHHYTYGPGTQIVGAGLTVPVQFQILNHDFEADFLVATRTGAFKARIQIGDRYLSNVPIVDVNHFGTAQNPLPLLSPLQLKRNDVVIITLTDISGAANTIDLGFIGREIN
jgi:hypothetical protein